MLIFINIILLIFVLTIIFNKKDLNFTKTLKQNYSNILNKIEHDIEIDYEKELINEELLITVLWAVVLVVLQLIFLIKMLNYDIYIIPTVINICILIYCFSKKKENVKFNEMSKEKKIDYLKEQINKCNSKLGFAIYYDAIYLIYSFLILTNIIH
ncbi:hypothetical protein [Clostridium sp. CTA-6]